MRASHKTLAVTASWKFIPLAAATFALLLMSMPQHAAASQRRHTPIVQAVAKAGPAIVNIHGQKLIDAIGEPGDKKRVNGMGTGVIIDPRGYIITNHHVIDGVRRIQVTMDEGRTYVARLIARDTATDLAIIKIDVNQKLPLVTIGTSQDLMPGEPVIAVGNAYGYHHTVTRGIISALNRAVEVTDAQKYYDLIQTDASINPGNSGGPLLNIDGEMIGINVAVRVGAQGIGFAIPVDKVMDIAANLLSTETTSGTVHGVRGATRFTNGVPHFVVTQAAAGSPAQRAGIRPGDIITAIGETRVRRQLDIERALLGMKDGEDIRFSIRRDSGTKQVGLQVASAHHGSRSRGTVARVNATRSDIGNEVWRAIGVRLQPVSAGALSSAKTKYNGGLRVTAVRANSVASQNGIQAGDVLVGMHIWETVTMQNLDYILNRADLEDENDVKFYVVRGNVTRTGNLPLMR